MPGLKHRARCVSEPIPAFTSRPSRGLKQPRIVPLEESRICQDITSLRGLEGEASALYFSCFDTFILRNGKEFRFHGRSKRPPLDRVNAMLSFGYSLIYNECIAALESVGLDASAGFLHTDYHGRKSLACDLVEEFRSCIVDRFVLSMINENVIRPEHFEMKDNNGIYLNQEGRKVFLHHWQNNKRNELLHPYLKEKICIGLIPFAQASLLAKVLREELPTYPSFSRR